MSAKSSPSNSGTLEDADDFYGVLSFKSSRSASCNPALASNAAGSSDVGTGKKDAIVNGKVKSSREDDFVFRKYQEVKSKAQKSNAVSFENVQLDQTDDDAKARQRSLNRDKKQESNVSKEASFKLPSGQRFPTRQSKRASEVVVETESSDSSEPIEIGQSEEFGQVSPFRKAIEHVAELRNDRVRQPARSGVNVGVSRDSKGFRVLKYDANELEDYTENELVQVLLANVLYEDDRCIIINKPSGIETTQSTAKHSIEALLPHFIRNLNRLRSLNAKKHTARQPTSVTNAEGQEAVKQLNLVHRLDRQTTGCLLLAKHEDALHYLKAYFAERRIIKRYLCVARGVPHEAQGCIDVPIGPARIGGVERMFVYPQPNANDTRYNLVSNFRGGSSAQSGDNHARIREAITQFRVITSNNGASLLECEPRTGIRHQVRVHLAYVLECPILGDHKYSHVTKLAPQKLNSLMLRSLGMRQAKVRNMPLHLHASSLCLPQYFGDARSLHVNAPLPNYFLRSLKWLKLSMK